MAPPPATPTPLSVLRSWPWPTTPWTPSRVIVVIIKGAALCLVNTRNKCGMCDLHIVPFMFNGVIVKTNQKSGKVRYEIKEENETLNILTEEMSCHSGTKRTGTSSKITGILKRRHLDFGSWPVFIQHDKPPQRGPGWTDAHTHKPTHTQYGSVEC